MKNVARHVSHLAFHVFRFTSCATCLAALLLPSFPAAALDVVVSSGRIHAAPGQEVPITVNVNGLPHGVRADVRCRVINHLSSVTATFDGATDAAGKASFSFAPTEEYGYEVWAEASANGEWASASAFFACSRNPYATAVDYSYKANLTRYLDLRPDGTPYPKGKPGNPQLLALIEERVAYFRTNYLNVVESQPYWLMGAFEPGILPADNIFTYAFAYSSVNGWRWLFQRCHDYGISCVVYSAAFLSGLDGSEFARKNPDLISYERNGIPCGGIDTQNTAAFRAYYADYPASLKDWDKKPGLRGKAPDFTCGRVNCVELRAVDFAIAAVREGKPFMGYDGIRFDGHYTVPALGDPLGVSSKVLDYAGNAQPIGAAGDALTARNMRHAMGEIRASFPDFMFGFNWAGFREADTKALAALQEPAAIAPGSFILDECAKGALCPTARDNKWTDFIRIMGAEADLARAYDSFLFAGWQGGPGWREIDTRYAKAVSWALGFRWIAGGELPHGPAFTLYNQFAYRYSEYILSNARDRITANEAAKLISVGAADNRLPWFKDFVYRSKGKGPRFVVINLINPPVEDHLVADAKVPPAARNVIVTLRKELFAGGTPDIERIAALSPDYRPFLQPVKIEAAGDTLKVTSPDFGYWSVLVIPYQP